jgi:uncharacterized protein YkwD
MKRFISSLLFLLLISSAVISAPKSNAATVLLKQSDARLLAIETQLGELINQERAGRHLSLLVYDSQLAEVARAHSAEMRDEKYFSHQSPTPQLEWPLNRYQEGMKHTPRLVAENIYRRWGGSRGLPPDSARQAHQSLMNSPGHKANILLPSATRMGIGVEANAKGDVWITEMFVNP